MFTNTNTTLSHTPNIVGTKFENSDLALIFCGFEAP